MKRYWLIAYSIRRTGRDEVEFFNDSHCGSVVDWVKAAQKYPDEMTLLSAMPVAAKEYKWLKENL